MSESASTAERELRKRALVDRDRCCAYFPALTGVSGIICDLPACAAFAAGLPYLTTDEATYRFNFLRLSLIQQSADAAYHLDTDTETATTGEIATLRNRQLRRLLLNLSTRTERALHYLDVDPWSVELQVHGSYLCAAQPKWLRQHAHIARILPRNGGTVHGLAFVSNLVLHSGVDDTDGHFIAAYGIDSDTEASAREPTADWPSNAPST